MNYLIINLPLTQQEQRLIFWGERSKFDTPDPRQAMVVEEEYIFLNLERYFNGFNTHAVPQYDAINNPEMILNDLGIEPNKNASGEAA